MLMIGKQLTAEQRLQKAVIDIIGNPKYVALAGILMLGNRTVSDKIPTACTNGRDEMYGRAFVDSLSDTELRFVVLHECYHKLYRHLTTWKHLYDANARKANIACDHVINLKILAENADGFAVMPKDRKTGKPIGVLDHQYTGMDTAQVYHAMPDQPQQGGGGQGGGQCQGGGEPGEGESQSQPGEGNMDGGLDSHDWEGAQSMSDEEKKELERDIDEAVRQGVLAAGKLGSGGMRDLEELLKTKIDWREVLREFVTTTCAGNEFSTWKRPNRRFVSSGIYMPSGVSEKVGELVLAIDTSGSIGSRELSQFLGEVKGICDTVKPDKVRLLYWDTRVCRDETYVDTEVENITQSTKPAGGGGTDVECVTSYMAEHGVKPQAVVVLTDGYLGGSWGTWPCPVLWCIVGGNNSVAPVGTTVHVKD